MARIRTIKPTFFRHEGLQDLEAANPGQYVMLVFAGLWGHCDKAGRFEWRPRQLKLDILPFLDFEIAKTLEILRAAGLVIRYAVDGKEYGAVPSFGEHQRIGGKEAQEPEKFPAPPVNEPGSAGEAAGKHLPAQEGNGVREGEGNNKCSAKPRRARLNDPSFEKFYEGYPNKKARADAEKAWPRALEAAGNLETILTGLENYKRGKPDWQQWAYPATWLRERRWEDQPTPDAEQYTRDAHAPERAALLAWLKPSRVKGGVWLGHGPPPNDPGCTLPAVLKAEFGEQIAARKSEIDADARKMPSGDVCGPGAPSGQKDAPDRSLGVLCSSPIRSIAKVG